MAVGQLSNDAYTLKSVAANLERIKKANAFFTDVASVTVPDFDPNEEHAWLMRDTPSIHVWADSDLMTGEEHTGDMRPTLRVAIIGVVKQAAELQFALLNLKTDVRRIMIENGSQEFPGLNTDNRWAIYTGQASGIAVLYRYHADRTASFLSFWDVFYSSPYPTG